MNKCRDALRGSESGAVYVEFLIAFLPVLFFFLALMQLIFLQTANVIVKHAAEEAARAAVVVLHDDPAQYGGVEVGSFSGKRKTDIERAAKLPIVAMGFNLSATKVIMNGSYGRDEVVKVRVEHDYKCKVPWGRFLLCGFGNKKKLVAEAELPNQGADYEY
jgi:hypothetical protein